MVVTQSIRISPNTKMTAIITTMEVTDKKCSDTLDRSTRKHQEKIMKTMLRISKTNLSPHKCQVWSTMTEFTRRRRTTSLQ